MNNQALKTEEALNLLKQIDKKSSVSQRLLSDQLDISLGKINFLLRELSKKGWVKIKNASHSNHKLKYIYLLTPEGIMQKSILTKMFLERKIAEYDKLKGEIEKLKFEIGEEKENG